METQEPSAPGPTPESESTSEPSRAPSQAPSQAPPAPKNDSSENKKVVKVANGWKTENEGFIYAVSYTHLTLPTICSV